MHITEDLNDVMRFVKYIQFPHNATFMKYSELENYNIVQLPWNSASRYTDMPGKNERHYTTEWHRGVVMPALSELLGFTYAKVDFELVEHFI